MKWDFIESVEFEGSPRQKDLEKIEAGILELVDKIKNKILE